MTGDAMPTNVDPAQSSALEREAASVSAGADVCRVCGKVLTYSGTGRHPTLCIEHRGDRPGRKRKPRAAGGSDAIRPTGKATGATVSADKLTKALYAQLYQVGIVLWAIPKTRADGAVVLQNAAAVSQAWGALAKQDPAVRRALTIMTTGTAWGQAITATAILGVQVGANHGLVPPEIGAAMGTVNKVNAANGPAVTPDPPEAATDGGV